MTRPEVSIIVPNYNHAPFLEQRLRTIYDQTYRDFEVILLDDCSLDHSHSILNSYKSHEKTSAYVINDENSGSTFKQWCKGFELAKGKFIWIAESDDFSSLSFLEHVMNVFDDTHLNPDIVFVGTQNVDEHGKAIERKSRIERKYEKLFSNKFSLNGYKFLPQFLPNYCIIRNASSAVFKKSILDEDALRVSQYNTIGDYYFWVNACLKNKQFTYLPEILNFMRSHPNNVRQSPEKSSYKQNEFNKVHNRILISRFFDWSVLRILLKYKLKQIRKR